MSMSFLVSAYVSDWISWTVESLSAPMSSWSTSLWPSSPFFSHSGTLSMLCWRPVRSRVIWMCGANGWDPRGLWSSSNNADCNLNRAPSRYVSIERICWTISVKWNKYLRVFFDWFLARVPVTHMIQFISYVLILLCIHRLWQTLEAIAGLSFTIQVGSYQLQ